MRKELSYKKKNKGRKEKKKEWKENRWRINADRKEEKATCVLGRFNMWASRKKGRKKN